MGCVGTELATITNGRPAHKNPLTYAAVGDALILEDGLGFSHAGFEDRGVAEGGLKVRQQMSTGAQQILGFRTD